MTSVQEEVNAFVQYYKNLGIVVPGDLSGWAIVIFHQLQEKFKELPVGHLSYDFDEETIEISWPFRLAIQFTREFKEDVFVIYEGRGKMVHVAGLFDHLKKILGGSVNEPIWIY